MKIRQLHLLPVYTQVVIQPQFHDLDPMNIVWHGNYAKYLEVARCVLLRKINYDYPKMKESGFAWPIVDMRIKYIKPAHYEEALVVNCAIAEWEYRLKIHYEICSQVTSQVTTRAYTTQVAVDMTNLEMCYQSPDVLIDCLQPFLGEV